MIDRKTSKTRVAAKRPTTRPTRATLARATARTVAARGGAIIGMVAIDTVAVNTVMPDKTHARRAAEAKALDDALAAPVGANRWTTERRLAFLAELGATGRVDLAVAKAEMGLTSLYALRRRDQSFAAAWADALAAHADVAEAIVLNHAVHGWAAETVNGGKRQTRHVMAERLMVEVLRRKRGGESAESTAAQRGAIHGKKGEAARLAIEARLNKLAERIGEGE